MMYVTERLIETGHPIIIEGNFVPAGIKKVDEAGAIIALLDNYACEPLTYMFKGETHVLYRRYIERDKTPERGDANKDFAEVPYDKFDGYCHNFDNFSVGGEIVEVDTTDFGKIDFGGHIERARLFLNSAEE